QGKREFIFKHDLIRDVAYEMLPRVERKRFHGHLTDWLERAAGEHLDSYFDQLAHHALSAGQEERAMNFLVQAAERAHRLSAHREETALLAQALTLGERFRTPADLAVLRAKRGTAFGRLGMWVEARRELELALGDLPPANSEQRTQLLVDLSAACFFALDLAGTRTYAQEAVSLAESLGRPELAADAMGWVGSVLQADGNGVAALEMHRRAHQRAGGRPMTSRGSAALSLYLYGEIDEAIQVGREAVRMARGLNHTASTMHGLPHLGAALAASGRYAEAMRVFDEARQFGKEYEVWSLLARSIAFSAGFHLDVYDFAGNQALAEEARELARANKFLPTVVSAGIDLLFNFTLRQEVAQAEKLLGEVRTTAEAVAGWHGWLWQIRLSQVQAELALARADWPEALRFAELAISQSQSKGRVKYQTLGLWTRAQALHGLGRTREAIDALRRAVELARPIGDPAMFLRPVTALLAIEGSDTLLVEARVAAQKILAALPEETMRRRFQEAEPVRALLRP
ncbi:MAG: hypothetical protein HYU43_05990, partial [Armatimonadetes bacterium]|nr:hypothetical protein [Armatimonadota bacterium]